MEEAFEQMRKDGHNDVDKLVQWMKDANVIEQTKEAETRTVALFDQVLDRSDVEFEKFKEVVNKVAEQNKTTFEQMKEKLVQGIPKLQEAWRAAASAVQDALAQK